MVEKNKKTFFDLEVDTDKPETVFGRYKNSWIEDTFHFEKIQGRNKPLPQTHSYIKNSLTKKRLLGMLVVISLFFILVFGRVVYLQIFLGTEHRILAEGNRQRIIPIPAERGLIYDRNGIQLSKNIPKFSLALIPQDLPHNKTEQEKIVERLAEITDQRTGDIREILTKYGSYSYESIIIKENLDYETALSIQIAASDLPGIFIARGSKRLYLSETSSSTPNLMPESDSSFSHILGYLSKLNPEELKTYYSKGYLPSDYLGKTGIEKEYEEQLRGIYGKRRIEVDALGREQSIIAEGAPVPGKHLVLSIDKNIQDKLEEIILNYLELQDKKRAVGVVLNPNNGEILALVSIPSYDNNDFSGGIDQDTYNKYIQDEDLPLFNRAIGGTYPSGSVIKPAIAATALQEGIININTTFLSTGGIRVAQWFFPDWQAGGHGPTNATKAIAWSVNTFFYYIGGGYNDFEGLGVEIITKYLRKFGLAEKLGIDLPGEATGFLPSIEWKGETKGEKWYIGDTYNLSIGQGDLLVTPLQMAVVTAAIANEGTVYQPHLVKNIVDPASKEEIEIKPKKLHSTFIHSNNMKTVKKGMRECVIYGSCRLLSNLPFDTAGKTGTAQWSSINDNHAWFISFAPYENPEIAVTVLVEEGEEGSRIATPIVYDFYKWWWSYSK